MTGGIVSLRWDSFAPVGERDFGSYDQRERGT